MTRRVILIVCALLAVATARAEDNSSTLITNLVDNAGADYIVGNTGTNNSLTISDGGILTNIYDAYIGYETSASNNWAVVTDSGSAWYSTNSLVIGLFGAYNSLTISSGGCVYDSVGIIGLSNNASANAVLVTDPGSSWINSSVLYIGQRGRGNCLTVSNGALVESYCGELGLVHTGGSNTVLVINAGSVWTNSTDLYVGDRCNSNAMTIANGGAVFSRDGFIGSGPLSNAGNGNDVLITGAGSLWINSGTLYVGYGSCGNTLTILNSGVVVNSVGCIGNEGSPSSGTGELTSNAVLVSDSGSVWNNNALYVGDDVSGNTLTITNGGVVSSFKGYIGNDISAKGNAVLVTGFGSIWSNSADLNIGLFGSTNRLIIASAGSVVSEDGYISYYMQAKSNTVFVTGNGSVWTNQNSLTVGYFGSRNTLTIAEKATVRSAFITIGSQLGANSNSVVINEGVCNCTDMLVGEGGKWNNLIITNGGQAYTQQGFIGEAGNSNTVIVTGTGSVWSNDGYLLVGYIGTGNMLTIADGGAVFAGTATIAYGKKSARLNLQGGMLSIANLLTIQNNATLSGNGTISGNALVNGTVLADIGSGLTFTGGTVTNNGALRAMNASVLESWGPVVNNGVIDIIYGNTNFHSTFINNGIVLTAGGDPDGDGMSNLQESLAGTIVTNSTSCLRITSMAREGDDVRITWTAVGGKSYVVQTNSVPGAGFADFSPVISVPGVGESVTNYVHSGGATNGSAFYYRVRLGP